MSNVTISESIKYIGADDTTLDLFESQYIIPNGISYNSYVILDEKVAVMDTIDARKSEEWFNNLSNVLAGRNVDYIVISHLEPDHAANIKALSDKYPDAKLVLSAKAKAMLPQFFAMDNLDDKCIIAAEGQELSLGTHNLKFIMAPMVHWPEVMLEYETTEKVLFSADAFGKFGALSASEDWTCEAQTLLKKAAALDIRTICPLHGPVLKENLEFYIGKYLTWSSYEPEDDGVLVACASIHGNTKTAAEKMVNILKEQGYNKVAFTDLTRDDMAEAIEDAFRYSRLIVAAASYDGGVFPPMEDFLNRLSHKAYQNRKVGIIENGSWAPTAGKCIKTAFEGMKNITICGDTVTIKSSMKDEDIANMYNLAEAIK